MVAYASSSNAHAFPLPFPCPQVLSRLLDRAQLTDLQVGREAGLAGIDVRCGGAHQQCGISPSPPSFSLRAATPAGRGHLRAGLHQRPGHTVDVLPAARCLPPLLRAVLAHFRQLPSVPLLGPAELVVAADRRHDHVPAVRNREHRVLHRGAAQVRGGAMEVRGARETGKRAQVGGAEGQGRWTDTAPYDALPSNLPAPLPSNLPAPRMNAAGRCLSTCSSGARRCTCGACWRMTRLPSPLQTAQTRPALPQRMQRWMWRQLRASLGPHGV